MTSHNERKKWHQAALTIFIFGVSWAVTTRFLKPSVNLGPVDLRIYGKLATKSCKVGLVVVVVYPGS